MPRDAYGSNGSSFHRKFLGKLQRPPAEELTANRRSKLGEPALSVSLRRKKAAIVDELLLVCVLELNGAG
jgi:hypothetical protein